MDKQQQIQEWSRLYDNPISEDEFKEICANLNGFFTTLKQWSDDEERMLAQVPQLTSKMQNFSIVGTLVIEAAYGKRDEKANVVKTTLLKIR